MDRKILNIEIINLKRKIEEFKVFLKSLKKEEDYKLEEIKSKIKDIILADKYSKEYYYHYFLSEGLYRARKHKQNEKEFNTTKDFWFRDWSKVNKKDWCYERLNLKGESVWYFSNKITACIAETRPNKGDFISIANIKQFTFPRRFNYFLHLGSAYLFEADSNLEKMHNDAKTYRKLSETDTLIESFLDEIFLQKVSDNEKFKYIPSIALKEILKYSNHGIKTDGIIYPSVALEQNAVNIVLLNPKSEETNFYINQTIMFEVIDAVENKFYKVVPLLVGKNFNENRFEDYPIHWQYPNREEISEYNYTIEMKTTPCTL